MRKSLIILASLLFFIMLPKLAFAVDYSIEDMTIDVYLQEDGSVFVSEQFIYDFPSSFNGIIRTLHAKDDTEIANIAATEDRASLTVEQEGNDYLIHRPGKKETITITLTYTIEKGMDIYSDIGEFYWSFFDENNPSDYEQVTIVVHPPQETDDVIALGYGAAEGIATVSPTGQVDYSFGKVKSGVGADVRVAYDSELFPQAAVTEDAFMKDDLIAEQKAQIEARENYLQKQSTAKKVAPFIIVLFGSYLLILIVYAWRKHRQVIAEIDRRYSIPFFVPKERLSLPATILYMHSWLSGDALTAALFDLVRKGNVAQDDESTFIDLNKSVDFDHEQQLIDWLFYTIGTDGKFQAADLEVYAQEESNQEQYHTDYQSWQQAVRKELDEHELYESNSKQRIFIGVSSLLLVPCFGYLVFYDHWAYAAMSGALFAAFLLFALFYHPRTLLGKKIKADWDHFENSYEDVENKDWTKLRDDEQRRAFIYSLGTGDEKLVTKNAVLVQETNHQVFPGVDATTLIMLSVIMNTQFNQANEVSAQTSDMSTISTGAGVGGSGGGSSAF